MVSERNRREPSIYRELAAPRSPSSRSSSVDMVGGAYSALLAGYFHPYHSLPEAHDLADQNLGSHCGSRGSGRSRRRGWYSMVLCDFAGGSCRVFRTQGKRGGNNSTQTKPRRVNLSILVATVSASAWGLHAVVEVVRLCRPTADLVNGLRRRTVEPRTRWAFRPLRCRSTCLYRGDEPQAIEVASLALPTLWMRFSWFVVETMDAQELRLLRLTKGK